MPAANTSVKYFHSAMTGAPVLSGAAGTLLAVLDACLVNGFGSKTADSVVVAGGIATVNLAGGIGAFEADAVVLVSGATPAGLNGEKRIIATTATTITFDATGIADQTATGTIGVKLAPAGWNKPFSGTNLGAYQSADIASTKALIRVDDTGVTNARVVGYSAMIDINTGTGQFPTAAQMAGGLYWPKAYLATFVSSWMLIADGKTFYLAVDTAAFNASSLVTSFGDFVSYKNSDPYSCAISGATTDIATSNAGQTADIFQAANNQTPIYLPRAHHGMGSAISVSSASESYSIANVSGQTATASTPAYPNGAGNLLFLTRKIIYEPGSLRGCLRGLLLCPQAVSTIFSMRQKIDGTGAYAGRKLVAILCGIPASPSTRYGLGFMDITGPWS